MELVDLFWLFRMDIVVDKYRWPEFKTLLLQELYDGPFIRSKFIFRGQSNSDWGLVSSFDRIFDNKILADQMIREFADGCLKYNLISESIIKDDVLTMSLGQHYGLPTRLLDWTYSPYIAAFFAFTDFYNVNIDYVAIWCLHLNDIVLHQDIGVQIVIVKQIENLRLRNQDGLFTLLKSPDNSLDQFVNRLGSKFQQPILRKILVPTCDIKLALADLDSMGINFSTIYPDINGVAMYAKMKVYFDSIKNEYRS